MSKYTGASQPRPSAAARSAAAVPSRIPWFVAVLWSYEILVVLLSGVHGAWAPTQIGSRRQPYPVTVLIHCGVRLGCEHPRFAPPM